MARHKVPIKRRQPGMASRPLMRYEQQILTMSLGSSTVGDDFSIVLFDISSRSSNKYCKLGKMTIQWWTNFNEQNLFYFALYKAKEGATAPSLDDVSTIRDLRSEGRLIRPPTQISTRGPGIETANVMWQRKTIVIEDILLDPNDDVSFGVTTRLANTSGTNEIRFYWKYFWKVVE